MTHPTLPTESDFVLLLNLGYELSFRVHIKIDTVGYYSPNTITDKELDSWIDSLESQHLTVILDTSYSGTMNALHERGRTVIGSTNTLIQKQDTEQQQLGQS